MDVVMDGVSQRRDAGRVGGVLIGGVAALWRQPRKHTVSILR